ncbi:MAG: hypothetical protein ABI432_13080 [Flavobacteriales bacterium]
MRTRNHLPKALLYYLVTGVLISGLAFVNHYPLVYSDSGAYMDNSFTLVPYHDRPIGYGLIIRALTWQSTMWTVVVFQGIVVSWLLMLMVRELVGDERRWVHVHLLLLAFLALFSSLPWYAAQLMADHYTPLVLIILFLLFKATRLGPWREGVLWVLLFFFLATHNAHFPMVGILLVAVGLRHLRGGKTGWRGRFSWKWAGAMGILAGAALMVMLFNYSAYGRLRLSLAGNVFLAGRLCEPGIMADYLDNNCATRPNPLCAYRENMPEDTGDLLWSSDQFVNAEHLTIGQADSLLAPVVKDILSKPEYLARYARSILVSTVTQLFQWEGGTGLIPYGEGSSPRYNLVRRIPEERHTYDKSRQQWWGGYWEQRDAANRREAIALIVSLVVLALQWRSTEAQEFPLLRSLTLWVIGWVVLNAAVTSGLAAVDPRLQSRVMWLLPMTAFLLLVNISSWANYFKLKPEMDKH